jgi:hypothetical protein
MVRAVQPENWDSRDEYISQGRRYDPGDNGIEDALMDVEEIYKKAGKEEEDGKV